MSGVLDSLYARLGAGYPRRTLIAVSQTAFAVVPVAVAVLALYVHMSPGRFLILVAAGVAFQAGYNLALAMAVRRELEPVAAWLAGGRASDAAVEAWNTAAGLPLRMLRQGLSPRRLPGALTWVLVPCWAAFAVWRLRLPAYAIPIIVAAGVTFIFYAEALRFLLSELVLRPVLADIAQGVPAEARLGAFRIPLRWRQLLVLPGINVITGVVVAGIVGGGTASFQDMATAIAAAVIVAATVSLLLIALVSTSVSAPIVALQSAAERVGDGDFEARVPVVTMDETGELSQAFNSMTAGLAERERIRETFGTYVDREVAEHILRQESLLAGDEVEVTVMFLDIRDFTKLAERSSAREVVATVNRLFERVVPIIYQHGGHVDKFVGDGLLAVFGAPRRWEEHADQALAAALAIAPAVQDEFADELAIGVGLNSGTVLAGNVGGAGRLEFSVIGDAVNVAARVESATRKTGDTILISDATKRLLTRDRVRLEARPHLPLQGKTKSVALYAPASSDSTA